MVSILGIGLVSAAGNSLPELRETLTGRREPRVEVETVATAEGDVSLPVYRAEAAGLDRFVAKRALRRVDPFARMALLASHLAREDAALEAWGDSARVGVVFGSGYGPTRATFSFQDSVIDDGDKCASPTLFANSVHNALASQVSISMGIEGPCQTVTTFDATMAGVIGAARALLDEGEADFVLAGMGDEVCPVGAYGFASARASAGASSETIRPFDFESCSALPGEGFVAFLLGRDGGPGKYGQVHDVRFGRSAIEGLADLRALVVAADGRLEAAGAYRRALPEGVPLAGYASLFGAMPTGGGFGLAAAALALSDGVLRPALPGDCSVDLNVARDEVSLAPGDRVGCLQCGAEEGAGLVVVGI